MTRTGIIDIGSNSVRLIIVEIKYNKYFRILYELKESVRLGKDMGSDNNLDPDRMNNAINTINSFKTICDSYCVHNIIAVATEAVRRASNRKTFLNLLQSRTGIDIRVLSGKEEAYYDYLGVINSMDVTDCLIMDIGGSSMEFILVKDKEIQNSISVPYGSISLTELYMINPACFSDAFGRILMDVPWIYKAKGLPLIGIGGTFRNTGKIDRKRKDYPIDNVHNYRLIDSDVLDIHYLAIDLLSGKQKKIKGLSNDRADIFIGPIAAIQNIINVCNTKDIFISGCGVREGILFEYILKGDGRINNVLDYSLENAMINFDVEQESAHQLYSLCSSLYSQLKPLFCQNANADKIIKTAALLHDSGIKINFYDHHKHSFYAIMNSRLSGLTHKELLMASYVAALHRKDEFKIDLQFYKCLINQIDVLYIQQLGILLKICEKLTLNGSRNIENIACSISENSVTMKLKSRNKSSVEIEAALCCKSTFKRLFNKKLLIE
jgi:exopolyphosphatase/guanosine-5'-triphosphate,3'-diphosphate pyrophosphatase